MNDLLDLLAAIQVRDQQSSTRQTRLPEAFAAKWAAEHGPSDQPTDENLAATFAECARPARPKWYPAIREAIARTQGAQ